MTGLISFVGAGPGAPDLITLRGAQRLSQADLVIWASSLVPEALLEHARASATIMDSAGMTLEDVLAAYEDHPSSAIVRLHSGDPSIYGAIQEQIDWCLSSSRDFEVVPGVSALAGAASSIARELTLPGVSQSVILTRLASRTAGSVPTRESISTLAASGSTMAVFLSAAHPADLQARLLEPPSAFDAQTPVAIVHRATWPDERIVLTRLGSLADDLRELGFTTTVLVLVGDFLEADPARSHLYSPAFAHSFRKRSLPGETEGRPVTGRQRA